MSTLPQTRKYALRHGTTGRIWECCPGLWLFKSPKCLETAWKTAKKCGLVNSEFSEHVIVVIMLVESQEKACMSR
jgi:hypothetical protein